VFYVFNQTSCYSGCCVVGIACPLNFNIKKDMEASIIKDKSAAILIVAKAPGKPVAFAPQTYKLV
jgi:hypothetical protein